MLNAILWPNKRLEKEDVRGSAGQILSKKLGHASQHSWKPRVSPAINIMKIILSKATGHFSNFIHNTLFCLFSAHGKMTWSSKEPSFSLIHAFYAFYLNLAASVDMLTNFMEDCTWADILQYFERLLLSLQLSRVGSAELTKLLWFCKEQPLLRSIMVCEAFYRAITLYIQWKCRAPFELYLAH